MPIRQYIPQGTTRLTSRLLPVTLNTGDLLYGSSDWASVLSRDATYTGAALIQSRDFDGQVGTELHWEYEGAVCAPRIEDLLLNGNGNVSFLPHALNSPDIGRPDECGGIRLMAAAPRLSNLRIMNVAGTGIYARTGSNLFNGPTSPLTQYDGYEPYLINNRISHCFKGMVLDQGEDMVSGNIIYAVRDVGILKRAAGGHVIGNHVYGAPIGIQDADATHVSVGTYTDNEVETCGIGFLAYYPGTKINGLQAYNNYICCLDAHGNIKAVNLVFTIVANTTGVFLRHNSPNSRLHGELDCSASGTVGVEFVTADYAADYSDYTMLDLFVVGGTAVKVKQPISYSRWELSLKNSQLNFLALGTFNQINIVGNITSGDIHNNTGNALSATNRITLNGTLLSL